MWPWLFREQEAQQAGLSYQVLPIAVQNNVADSKLLCQLFLQEAVDGIIFAGGDGTARDVLDATKGKVPVIGIPAGVKIHSGVFAKKTEAAGELLREFILDILHGQEEAEVMDIDENLYREGMVAAKLYGYLSVPFNKQLLQGKKARSQPSGAASQQSIAWDIIDNMHDAILYLVGPGSTTSCIMKVLQLPYTLIGIDAVYQKQLIGKDLNEMAILKLLQQFKPQNTKLILTPISGQGILLGRGNQQISPNVLRLLGKENFIIIACTNKLVELHGKPFCLDTGYPEIDIALRGYYPVVTGYKEEVVYKVDA